MSIEKNKYLLKNIENLNAISMLEDDSWDEIKCIKLICFNVNNDNKYPFIQVMLQNFTNNFDFPLFYKLIFDDTNFLEYIINQIKYKLESIGCDTESCIIKNLGFLDNDNIRYFFIDISEINITSLFLKKTTEIWFGTPTELINNKHICNISVNTHVVDFISKNIDLFTLLNPDNLLNYPNPEISYSGSPFKLCEFQSIFGISKIENIYGNNYYFTYSFQNAIKQGSWSINNLPEHKYGKLITDNNYGRYIMGGINRVCLLIDKIIYLNENEILENENIIEFINEKFNIYDTIFVSSNENSFIILKDYDRQSNLSYHKINKSLVGDKWMNNVIYSIE